MRARGRATRWLVLGLSLALVAFACAEAPRTPADPATEAADASADASATDGFQRPRPETTRARVLDLGGVDAEDEASFDVPPNALGFSVVVTTDDDDGDPVAVRTIRAPDGALVLDDYTPVGGRLPTAGPHGRIAASSVPQNDQPIATPPAPGRWTLRFANAGPPRYPDGGSDDAGPGPHRAHATVRIQLGSAEGFVGGELDLHLYLPAGLTLDHRPVALADPSSDAALMARVDAFFAATKSLLDLDRGRVTFHTVGAEYRGLTDVFAIERGFSLAQGEADEQAFHVLFTNGIADVGTAFGGHLWGIAPGTPGAAMTVGTPMSGVILAVGETPADGDAFTLVHELGHFVGLTHTTEIRIPFADALADTPTCEALDELVDVAGCPDKFNLMFPTLYAVTAGELTPSQRRIFHGSPIYRAYAMRPTR